MFFVKKSGKTTIVYPGGKDSDFRLNCFIDYQDKYCLKTNQLSYSCRSISF